MLDTDWIGWEHAVFLDREDAVRDYILAYPDDNEITDWLKDYVGPQGDTWRYFNTGTTVTLLFHDLGSVTAFFLRWKGAEHSQ